MIRLSGLTLSLLILLASPQAAAQYSLAVLGVDMGNAPANRTACIADTLKSQVKLAPGFDMVPGKDLDEIKMVFGCFDESADCMAKAGKSLQVERLLWGRLEADGSNYNLVLLLLDVTQGSIERSVTHKVPATDLRRTCARKLVKGMVASILTIPGANLSIRVNVAGARVTVGDRFIGLTEEQGMVSSEMRPGTHVVQVKKDGYLNWEQPVELRAGEKKVINVALQAVAAPVTQPVDIPVAAVEPQPQPGGSRNLGWKVAFWSSAVATVGLAVGLGITGSEVINAENDKEDYVIKYRTRIMSQDALPPSYEDICSDPRKAPGGDLLTDDEVRDIQGACDKGKEMALVTNVLIGVTVAMAAVSGILYYKAYLAGDSAAPSGPRDGAPSGDSASVRWQVTPSAGPGGAGIGVNLTF